MENLEKALRNIDIFCKILVDKLTADDNKDRDAFVEPMEKLLYKRNILNERAETDIDAKPLIPLSHLENPLIDVVEENDHLKILVQEHCKDKLLTIHTDADGIEICRRECHTDQEGTEECVDKCQKIELALSNLQVDNMTAKCNNNNNAVFEIAIPKR